MLGKGMRKGMNMLEVSHISKRFGEKIVLKDVSFSVPQNCIFGFVGQNGAGKTTTMKMILGLLKANHGEIYVNGVKVSYGQNQTNRYIGYLPDVPEYYDYMTPVEYLRFCGEVTGMSGAECKARTEEMLMLVGLDKEKHRIKGFSRGMKQRLGIAQALLNRPKLLVCDEPTSALDPVGRKEILDILVAAKKETTILFSTHILSDVERICDSIAFLHQGEIVFSGNMDSIKTIHQSTGFEVDLVREEDVQSLLNQFPQGERLRENGLCYPKGSRQLMEKMLAYMLQKSIAMRRIEVCEPTLEAVFMEVVGK